MFDFEKVVRVGAATAAVGFVGAFFLRKMSERSKFAEDKKILSKIINDAVLETPFLSFSVQELSSMIVSGEITSEEVVKKFIEQIQKVEPYINAVTDDKFEEALEEAKEIDSMLAKLRQSGDNKINEIALQKPLLGVPFVSKEIFEVPGLRFCSGLAPIKENRGKKWNPVLWRLKEAGGIFLANGNVAEGCMWYECYNKAYGRTNNPYDPSRTAGGSSGGGGSLVAALGAPFAVTSDVGGSTRIPALFNGLFGHKPSGGAIPGLRNHFLPTNLIELYTQMGVICRHSSDLQLLNKIMAGPITEEEIRTLEITDEENKWAHLHKRFEWDSNESNCFDKNVKIIVLKNQPRGNLPTTRTQKDQLEAKEKLIQAFRKNGNPIESVTLPLMNEAFDLWGSQLMQGEEDPSFLFAERLSKANDQKIWPVYELLKHNLSGGLLSDFTLPTLFYSMFDLINKRFKPKWIVERENKKFKELKNELYHMLGTPIDENGNISEASRKVLMISPSLPMVAPKHGPFPHLIFSADIAATAIYNVLQLPATQVPTGLGSKDVPTGAQIIGGYGTDALCLSAAEFLGNQGVCNWSLPAKT